jgi:hypothetical protein
VTDVGQNEHWVSERTRQARGALHVFYGVLDDGQHPEDAMAAALLVRGPLQDETPSRGQSAGVRYPGHCARCGVGYETPTRPQCECAGDPPIDHDSRNYQVWVDRVVRLRWDAPGR